MSINKKLIALVLVFFGGIVISLSERSMSLDSGSDMTRHAISHKLSNALSSYPKIADNEEKIREFLNRWNIEGASVAIAKNERLVYAKGFGYANREDKERVRPKHLFRVASISKLITGVAVMRLNEAGKLDLHDQVFGENGILSDPKYQNIRDSRVKDITIYHLLTHSGGWDIYGGDPVFMPYTISRAMDKELPIDLETTIKYTLSQRRLDFTPGTRSSYSNFGYSVLAKVIEKVTGMDYEFYVTSRILNPLDIYDMHLGHARLSKRFSNEVKYYLNSRNKTTFSSFHYRKRVPRYYGGTNLQVLGAAGAWIASPAELLKFLVHIDGFPGKKDILSQKTLNQMIYSKPGYRPIGWVSTTYNGTWRRSGSLAGTSALLKRCNNGFSWVMLLNTSNGQGHDFTYKIDEVMSKFIRKVDEWPQHDLFEYTTPKPLYTYTSAKR
ncbi:MAG: beta-lactamase family protein [Bacteroidales bacterium]|nr:beta-lactamase family protein [Bacteroidales bacterium]